MIRASCVIKQNPILLIAVDKIDCDSSQNTSTKYQAFYNVTSRLIFINDLLKLQKLRSFEFVVLQELTYESRERTVK